MNRPVRFGSTVVKDATDAAETLHHLLCHVRDRGVDWVPVSISVENGKHTFEFIAGEVPKQLPDWIWNRLILGGIAQKLRFWHDATTSFPMEGAQWNLPCSEPVEVICHNDVAPYNTVFQHGEIVGLIDFDVCSPGSRIWDLCYAAYRFVPLVPETAETVDEMFALFSKTRIQERLSYFLAEYAMGDGSLEYSTNDLVNTAKKRLSVLADWTDSFAEDSEMPALHEHARVYRRHEELLDRLLV